VVHLPESRQDDSDIVIAPHTPTNGQLLLGRYRIIDVMAHGSASTIYRADDERLSRTVCVKILRQGTRSGGIARTTFDHFVQEAFALSRLTHPNTIKIYDFGRLKEGSTNSTDGQPPEIPFQVLEYIEGGTLADRVRERGPFDGPTTARLVTALAGALSEAHAAGIVHRDVKPNNILLVGDDNACTPKLADFGIAKTQSRTDTPAEFRSEDTEIVAGQDVRLYSMYWSAPEQFLSLGVTPAADVYSLALVTVFMLSGRVTLQTDDIRLPLVMRKHITENLVDALGGVSTSPGLLGLFADACEFDSARRIGDVQTFATRLRELLVGDVVIVGESLIESSEPRPREPATPTSASSEGRESTRRALPQLRFRQSALRD